MSAKKNLRKKRKRFHGFSLDPRNERDKVIGEWINSQANAAEKVKDLIYAAATGQTTITTAAAPPIDDTANRPSLDPTDPRAQRLISLET